MIKSYLIRRSFLIWIHFAEKASRRTRILEVHGSCVDERCQGFARVVVVCHEGLFPRGREFPMEGDRLEFAVNVVFVEGALSVGNLK